MSEDLKRYHPLSNAFGSEVECPPETPIGPWLCTCGDDPEEYVDFLEVHRSSNPDKRTVVFRVSEYSGHRGIKLGSCAILSQDQARQVRDRLNEFLGET